MEENESIVAALAKRLGEHDDSRRAVQEKLHKVCDGLRKRIDDLEKDINEKLEKVFVEEDSGLQSALNELRTYIATAETNPDELARTVQNAKSKLLVEQTYELIEHTLGDSIDISKMCELKTEKRLSLEWLTLRSPTNLKIVNITLDKIYLEFNVNINEEYKDSRAEASFVHKACLCKKGEGEEKDTEYILSKDTEKDGSFILAMDDDLELETSYTIKVKTVYEGRESEWCEPVEFASLGFLESYVWKKCPDNIDMGKKYLMNKSNPKVASKMYGGNEYCTIIGSKCLPPNKVTSWGIRLIKSYRSEGRDFFIGVAPFDINQNEGNNSEKCGWYFYFNDMMLYSGPPHNYKWKKYVLDEGKRTDITPDKLSGVTMDMIKGELSFSFNCINHGAAYTGIPLDKPLVPCVIIGIGNDFVMLDATEVTENVGNSIHVPSNIVVKSKTFDSITLVWDAIEGASFYQVEVDGVLHQITSKNVYTETYLLPETEHSFRVRTLFGNAVSEFSEVVKEKTSTAPEFSGCTWKECPDYAKTTRGYSLGKWHSRVATKNDDFYGLCTVVGNIPIPFGKATSWNIKILKSRGNNGNGIYVGVAPSDIDQNAYHNYDRCGWYFECVGSLLWSGPPHKYEGKEYGPRAENGKYVQVGSTIGVVMDTTKGELAFTLANNYLGVAYDGIPLDKPLVPCVLIDNKGDSVELIAKKVALEIIAF